MNDDWNWTEHGGCKRCGARDYGFDLPDERATFVLDVRDCTDEGWGPCDECPPEGGEHNCTDPEVLRAVLRIIRSSKQCPDCHEGTAYNVTWELECPDHTYVLRYSNEADLIIEARLASLAPKRRRTVEVWTRNDAQYRRECATEQSMGA